MTVLLFLHVLVGMMLLGAAVTAAVAGLAATRRPPAESRILRGVSFWAALLTAIAALASIVLGEALVEDRDVQAAWLDVSRALAILGLLGGGVAAAVLARLALERPRLSGAVGWLSSLIGLLALAVAFLMAAKPG